MRAIGFWVPFGDCGLPSPRPEKNQFKKATSLSRKYRGLTLGPIKVPLRNQQFIRVPTVPRGPHKWQEGTTRLFLGPMGHLGSTLGHLYRQAGSRSS